MRISKAEGSANGQCEAEADTPVMILVPDLVPFGYGAMDGPVVIATATQDALRTPSGERAAIGGDVLDFTRKAVLAPLPHVAAHVVNAQLVSRFLRDFMGLVATVALVPSHR